MNKHLFYQLLDSIKHQAKELDYPVSEAAGDVVADVYRTLDAYFYSFKDKKEYERFQDNVKDRMRLILGENKQIKA